MKYEYLVMLVVLIMAWQNFLLRRKIKQFWQAMDKRKYVERYREIISANHNQTAAIKQLRQEFGELNLLQAVQISQIAQQSLVAEETKSE